METINKNRLFYGSCFALVVTAMTFAIRARLETVFGPDEGGMGLTLEQIGLGFHSCILGVYPRYDVRRTTSRRIGYEKKLPGWPLPLMLSELY